MKYFFSLLLISILTGCVTTQPTGSAIDTTNLASLENLTARNVATGSENGMNAIRAQGMSEAALSLGAQAGLAWQANQFNSSLQANADNLDKSFNFRALLIDNKVLPPVLEQASEIVNLADPDTIRVADKTYKIVSQARFVTTPPNWRQYLAMNYEKPSLPDHSLLPRTVPEQEVWARNVQKGWIQGIDQAKTIYLDNIGRLKRDYNGMLLYRSLLSQNMISKPYVAEADMGVTSNDNNSQIYINDKVLRITALPQLNPNSKKWRSVITP